MPWYYILLIVLAVILFFLFSVCFVAIPMFLVRYMSYPKRYSRKESHESEKEHGLLEGEEQLSRVPFTCKMEDGYIIHGDVSLNGEAKKFVILCHGYSVNRECSLKYAMMFYRLGYSIVLYDHRSHGDNVHKDVTMGYKEAHDLHEIIAYVRKTYGEDIFLGLHGESMGAATILQVVQYHDSIDFLAEDCGYSSVRKLFSYLIRHQMHLSPFFLPMCDWYMKLFHGYHMKEASPLTYIQGCTIPLFVAHGETDTFIPKEHSDDIFRAFSGYKVKYLFPGAEHACSAQSNPTLYEQVLSDFVRKVESEHE